MSGPGSGVFDQTEMKMTGVGGQLCHSQTRIAA